MPAGFLGQGPTADRDDSLSGIHPIDGRLDGSFRHLACPGQVGRIQLLIISGGNFLIKGNIRGTSTYPCGWTKNSTLDRFLIAHL